MSYLVEGHKEETNPLINVDFSANFSNSEIKSVAVTPAEKRATLNLKYNNDRKLPIVGSRLTVQSNAYFPK